MPAKVEKESKGKCHQREAKQVVKQECTSKQGKIQAGQGAKPDTQGSIAIQVNQDRGKRYKQVHQAMIMAQQVAKS